MNQCVARHIVMVARRETQSGQWTARGAYAHQTRFMAAMHPFVVRSCRSIPNDLAMVLVVASQCDQRKMTDDPILHALFRRHVLTCLIAQNDSPTIVDQPASPNSPPGMKIYPEDLAVIVPLLTLETLEWHQIWITAGCNLLTIFHLVHAAEIEVLAISPAHNLDRTRAVAVCLTLNAKYQQARADKVDAREPNNHLPFRHPLQSVRTPRASILIDSIKYSTNLQPSRHP